MKTSILFAAAVLTANGAVAQDFIPPTWATPPDGDLASDLFPGFAGFLGVDGHATVTCRVSEDGPPFRCRIMEEMPAGLGFGAAARLVVASGQIRAARRKGGIIPATIQTTVRFVHPEVPTFGGWTGPEPSAQRLALAKALLASGKKNTKYLPSYREMMLDGLDTDRRNVVRAWLDELMPYDEAQETSAAMTQLARLFSEDELRSLLAGEEVAPPSEEELLAACPDPTPKQQTALDELRRRYCGRYGCDN
ncbi:MULTISPECIES: energy transducer TonB family protein [unclassified Brevundimonas]|uniref:energy transducer TonB family protein n=1 Tax=unclassified Brevundimonas TaxID=2622653 RepID=UPI003F936207